MNVLLRNVQYHPGADAVALLIDPPAPLRPFFVNTTQACLAARTEPGSQWGDAQAIAEAQAGVDAKYPEWTFTVVLAGAVP
jgi:hypothetical protein